MVTPEFQGPAYPSLGEGSSQLPGVFQKGQILTETGSLEGEGKEQEHGSYVSISSSQIHTRFSTLQAKAAAHCRGLRQGFPSPLQSKLLHSFLCDIFGIGCEERPLHCVYTKGEKARERETQRQWNRETYTEERERVPGGSPESR